MTVFSSSINEATSSRGVGVWGTVIYGLYSKNGGGSGAGGGGKTLINLHQNIASRYFLELVRRASSSPLQNP